MLLPEENLATAIIERALLDIFTRKGRTRMMAMAWIDGPERCAFSFLYLCEHLDLDPSVLRDIARKAYNCNATMQWLAPRSKNAFLRRFLNGASKEVVCNLPPCWTNSKRK